MSAAAPETSGSHIREDFPSPGGRQLRQGHPAWDQPVQLHLQKITYTGSDTVEGPYAVTFLRDRDLEEARRGDATIDARGGFKRVTADLLRRVEVTIDNLPIRAYGLKHTTGAFGKTLPQSVIQFGDDNLPFTTHAFSYHDDVRDSAGVGVLVGLAVGGYAMMPPHAAATGLPGYHQRVRAAAATAGQRSGQGRGDPCPAAPST